MGSLGTAPGIAEASFDNELSPIELMALTL
jgi:hypothetical protein